jgi:16S rRNA (guanine966-N2)-methyltransferase
VRVIAGSAKGRKLLSVPGDTTRPITDRVKESLFNLLRGYVEGTTWLDLFAGTGAVGIEALSQGAERVVFIDRVRKAIEVLRKNLETTGFTEQAQIVHGDAFQYLKHTDAAFDYIYVAPPQYQDLWAKTLTLLNEKPQLLAEDGRIIVQIHPKEFHPLSTPNLTMTAERRYGSTLLLFYAHRQAEREQEQEPEQEYEQE